MDSHSDREHQALFLRSLQKKAERMKERGQSRITGGKPKEKPLAEYEGPGGVLVRRLPDDEHGILRVSIGGGDGLPVKADYCVFRGDPKDAVALIERALADLRAGF